MLCSWRVKLKLLLATITLAVLLSWLYLFVGSLECEWIFLSQFLGRSPAQSGLERPRPWAGCCMAVGVLVFRALGVFLEAAGAEL